MRNRRISYNTPKKRKSTIEVSDELQEPINKRQKLDEFQIQSKLILCKQSLSIVNIEEQSAQFNKDADLLQSDALNTDNNGKSDWANNEEEEK